MAQRHLPLLLFKWCKITSSFSYSSPLSSAHPTPPPLNLPPEHHTSEWEVKLKVKVVLRLDFVSQGFRLVMAHDCWHKSLEPLMAEIRQQMGSGPVYISFDIDGLDPSFAPGTGMTLVVCPYLPGRGTLI